jgi:hypothetical protein
MAVAMLSFAPAPQNKTAQRDLISPGRSYIQTHPSRLPPDYIRTAATTPNSYRFATWAVNSPNRTRASAVIVTAFGSLSSAVQIIRALAVSPLVWYVRAAFAN